MVYIANYRKGQRCSFSLFRMVRISICDSQYLLLLQAIISKLKQLKFEEIDMPNFIVNTNFDHEVHDLGVNCGHLPDAKNQKSLGWHSDCHSAVRKAKETYPSANGCFYCANDCHTT